MAQRLPLVPSIPAYRVGTTLGGVQVILDLRWNEREEFWYMDLLAEDETPIRHGMKIVLGVSLGGRSVSPLFPPGMLVALDLAGTNQEATLDDLGTRVVVNFYPWDEI